MLSSGLPLAVPAPVDADASARDRDDARPRTATQLYREIDRLMTTLVRTSELRPQQEG